ncbi:MAG: lactate dehydrogenase-like 2-hydroxyacid dehydrogenase [Bacteriovoracaceae bacterium]|jgi:lactate dehydrogenase-like 2-hydroxyacid dehydrogenase
MEKQKIYVTENIPSIGLDLLRSEGIEVEVWGYDNPVSSEELKMLLKDCDGLISMLSHKIDKDLIEHCPRLKVISNYAVGYNNIDIEAATKNSVAVGNTPDVLTEATADLAMALLLSLSRRIRESNYSVHEGHWEKWEPLGFLGKSLNGKTLGVIGLGRIGMAFAKRCTDGFGMKLIHYSRSEKEGFHKTSLDTLLKESDVISLHCPLTDETNQLLNYERLKLTKKDCILINTARGEVIVQDDLIKILKEDHFFGVGLDVTAPEPIDPNSPLLGIQRVLITPHIGSADIETRDAMSLLTAKNILAGLNKEPLPAFVNPEAWS